MFAMMSLQRVRRLRVLKFLWLEVSWVKRKIPLTPFSTKASNSKKPVRYTSIKKEKPKSLNEIAQILLQRAKETKEKPLLCTTAKSPTKAATLSKSYDQSVVKTKTQASNITIPGDNPSESATHTEVFEDIKNLQEVVTLSGISLDGASENKTAIESMQSPDTTLVEDTHKEIYINANDLRRNYVDLRENALQAGRENITHFSRTSEDLILPCSETGDLASKNLTSEAVSIHPEPRSHLSLDLARSADVLCNAIKDIHREVFIEIKNENFESKPADSSVKKPTTGTLPEASDRDVSPLSEVNLSCSESFNSAAQKYKTEVVELAELVNVQETPKISSTQKQLPGPSTLLETKDLSLPYVNDVEQVAIEDYPGQICIQITNPNDLTSKLYESSLESSTTNDLLEASTKDAAPDITQVSPTSQYINEAEKSTTEVDEMLVVPTPNPQTTLQVPSLQLKAHQDELSFAEVDAHLAAQFHLPIESQDVPSLDLARTDAKDSASKPVDSVVESPTTDAPETKGHMSENIIAVSLMTDGIVSHNKPIKSAFEKCTSEAVPMNDEPSIQTIPEASTVYSKDHQDELSLPEVDKHVEAKCHSQPQSQDLSTLDLPSSKDVSRVDIKDLNNEIYTTNANMLDSKPVDSVVESLTLDGSVSQMSVGSLSSEKVVDSIIENFTSEAVERDATFHIADGIVPPRVQTICEALQPQFQDLPSPTWSSNSNPDSSSPAILDKGLISLPDATADAKLDISLEKAVPLLLELTNEEVAKSSEFHEKSLKESPEDLSGSVSLSPCEDVEVHCVSPISDGIESSVISMEPVLEALYEKLPEVAQLDPVQRLFLDKIREYSAKKRSSADPIDVEFGKAYGEELCKLQRLYGGGDLTQFPEFKFSEPVLDESNSN